MKRKLRGRWLAGLLAFCMAVSCLTATSFAATVTPAKPVFSSVKLTAKTTAKLTWKAAKNAKKYEVYYKLNSGTYKKLKVTTAKTFTHKSLKMGSLYSYKVRSVNGTKKSAFSVVKSVKTVAATKPTLTATASGAKITLKWKAIKNATGYNIYKKTANGYKKIGTTKNLLFKAKVALLNTKYTFKVLPYVRSGGKNFGGTGAVKAIRSARTAYLLDMMKPYRGEYYDYSKDYFSMGGDSYTHGLTIDSYTGTLCFNLKGRFKTLSFIAGLPDNDLGDGKLKIYLDGEPIFPIKYSSDNLPELHTVNISDCIQLKMDVEGYDGYATFCGLANIKVSN